MPYQPVKHLGEGPALVFAPHPDDEVFGCAGALLAHLNRQESVTVVLITDGVPGEPRDAAQIGSTRLAESQAAAELLGYSPPRCWHLQDRGLEYGEGLIERMADTIRETDARVIYAPALSEMHPDHRAVAMAAIEAVRRAGGQRLLAQYEVGVAMRPNCLLDISPHVARKAAAMQVFRSQLAAQRYDEHIAALNRFRTYTLPANVLAAEGYYLSTAAELSADPFAAYAPEYRRQRALELPAIPADLPLISVMIRSADRPTLNDALDSVAVQTYPHLEVVLVNVTGRAHSELPAQCGRFPLRVINPGRPLPRAEAANVALDNAQGDWLLFLDDDDWIEAHHLHKLQTATRAGVFPHAVYSGVQCVGPNREKLPEVHDQPFNVRRQWVVNGLPIHAVLFPRAALRAGCRFDEQFRIYEDWDFWLQLGQYTGFDHLPGVSAAYRVAGGASGVHDLGEINQGRQALFAKWGPLAGQALVDSLGEELARLESAVRKLMADIVAGNAHSQNLQNTIATLEGHISRLQQDIAQISASKDEHIAQLESRVQTQDGHIQNLQDELARIVAEKDGHIRQLQEDLTGSGRHLNTLQAELAAAIGERDGHIRNLQADVQILNQALEQLRLVHAHQVQLLDERQHRIDEQLATLHHQNVRLLELEQQRSQLQIQQIALEAAASASQEARAVLDAECGRLRDAEATVQAEAARLQRELGSARGMISALENEKAALVQEKNRLAQQYVDANVHVRNLDSLIAQQQGAYQSLLQSHSWRLTRPLRAVVARLRRVRALCLLAPRAAARVGGWGALLGKVLMVLQREGLSGVRDKALALGHDQGGVSLPPAENDPPSEYERWIASYDTLDNEAKQTISCQIESWPEPPTISILMPVYNTPEIWLRRAIESVLGQLYPHWELCIADDASPALHVKTVLQEYAARDVRIKLALRQKNGHISAASNSALALATGEFIGLLDHDDELVPHALFAMARAIRQHSEADLFYSDEDKVDIHGRRFDPYFKPDWNPDLFLSYNLFSHFGVYRSSLVRTLGGFREGFEGSQDYDLVLRAVARTGHAKVQHVPHILYHWRVIPGSTAASHGEKPYALTAAIKAVSEYLHSQHIHATVDESEPGSGALRVRYALPAQPPCVSIIIPTRDGYDLLRQCIDSVFAKTTYPDYEILVVDNGSQDVRVLDYLKDLAARNPRLRVIRDDRPFNYSALNNRAAREARGELLCLMNNDIEVITPDWLDEMASQALRPEIGIVGCRLWYPDDTLQHAGVILGMGGVAGHAHHKMTRAQNGYFSRARLVQNYSAVTAACLVVRKSVFQEVEGLNEADLAIAFNDVDLCLKVRDAGYRNLWTPFAELYHHESATRGFEDTPEKQARFAREIGYMLQRYGQSLQFDPAYNPNLALERQDYTLAYPPRVQLLEAD